MRALLPVGSACARLHASRPSWPPCALHAGFEPPQRLLLRLDAMQVPRPAAGPRSHPPPPSSRHSFTRSLSTLGALFDAQAVTLPHATGAEDERVRPPAVTVLVGAAQRCARTTRRQQRCPAVAPAGHACKHRPHFAAGAAERRWLPAALVAAPGAALEHRRGSHRGRHLRAVFLSPRVSAGRPHLLAHDNLLSSRCGRLQTAVVCCHAGRQRGAQGPWAALPRRPAADRLPCLPPCPAAAMYRVVYRPGQAVRLAMAAVQWGMLAVCLAAAIAACRTMIEGWADIEFFA